LIVQDVDIVAPVRCEHPALKIFFYIWLKKTTTFILVKEKNFGKIISTTKIIHYV